jgi:hypothetical protein
MYRAFVRRSVYVLGALMAVALAGPMLPLEIAIWFSGELLLYLEVVAGVLFASRAAALRFRFARIASSAASMWKRAAYPASPVTSWGHAALSIQ